MVRAAAAALVILLATAARSGSEAPIATRLNDLERAVAADPENLALAASYRQLTIAAGQFDRSIDFLGNLAKQKGSGPNVRVSLALAYVDKVPTAGDIRRLYLGRDAMNTLTASIAQRPCVLAYYMRGLINLYYNRFIFHRADKGVADLNQALALVTTDTPPQLVARVYTSLGDGYFRLEQLAKARETWSAGASKFPADEGLKERLRKDGEPLADVVTTALSAGRRVDTTLIDLLPIR